LETAFSLHQSDDLSRAESMYRDLLTRDEFNVSALHLLGILLTQKKEFVAAEELFLKVLSLRPNYADALNNCGFVMNEMRRFEEALAYIDRSLRLRPDDVHAHVNRGIALRGLNRLEEALSSYDHALFIESDCVDIHNNRGNVLRDLKRYSDALQCYEQALLLRPDCPETYRNRGNVLKDLGRDDEALNSYDRALTLRPRDCCTYINRGVLYRDRSQYDEALESYDRALECQPDHIDAHNARGNILLKLRRFDDALRSFDRALSIKEDFADCHNNRGTALRELGRFDEALRCYDRALAIKPLCTEASFNKSLSLLQLGELFLGWSLYENRLATSFFRRVYPGSRWSGNEPLKGKTLFVHWEQGFGDIIHFCRFLKLAEQRGASIIFSVQKCLHRLLQTLSPSIRLIGEDELPVHAHYHCPLMSLPLAFGIGLNDIPTNIPYLKASPQLVRKWRDRLGVGFKVGVAWQGSSPRDGRSFNLANLLHVSQIAHVRLISLQKNQGVEQLTTLPQTMKVERLKETLDADGHAFCETAAIIANMDLVICCDTSVAHVAGALGRPTWVALQHVPEWRWMLDRADSPWYPTMRLFRQRTSGDWESAFSEIELTLREHLIEKSLIG
jgi:tetratricopeptide (TPR) repeat protein